MVEIQTILNAYYSSVTINTTFTGATQVGQVDFATALTSGWNQSYSGKILTVNGGGDVNISNALSIGNPSGVVTADGNTTNGLSVVTAGDINVTASISTKGSQDYNYNNTMPNGGSVTLNSTAGTVRVSAQITTSGAISTSNANYGGSGGAISITGVGGVSISADLVAIGNGTANYGAITISDGNATVTSGGGVNDGVSGVIGGSTFTKSGVGVLKISGVNAWTGTTTISGGTLQLGSGSNIPDASAVSFSAAGTVLDMNGYSETIGSLAIVS